MDSSEYKAFEGIESQIKGITDEEVSKCLTPDDHGKLECGIPAQINRHNAGFREKAEHEPYRGQVADRLPL